jgi:pimeloyl-ACP methyl ester carboxylesterase
VIHGAEDHITPASMAEQYFDQVTAPVKRMVLIDGAGHFGLMTHMAQFAAALRDNVRPFLQ